MKTSAFQISSIATLAFSLSIAFQAEAAEKLSPCGLVGSIEQRIGQCSVLNVKQARANKNWELVSVSKKERELYFNRDLQLLWTDIMGYGVYDIDARRHADAVNDCSSSTEGQEIKMGLSLNFRLPSASEAKSALNEGLKSAFSQNLFLGRSDGGNNRGSMLPSWTSHTFFTADSEIGKGDRHYALRYSSSSVSASSTSIETYEGTYGTINRRKVLFGGDKGLVRCVASASESDLMVGSVSESLMQSSLQPAPIKSVFTVNEMYTKKPFDLNKNDPAPSMEQPCVEFRKDSTVYKRFLMPPEVQIKSENLEFLKIIRGYESIMTVFCTRDDSDYAVNLADDLAAPSRPLFISKDGTRVMAYDYHAEKFEEMWSIVGKADNGESILIHRGLGILVGPRQEKPMENSQAVELAKSYQMSFVLNDGQRVSLPAGKARLPLGREWSVLGRDGILQLRKDGWLRDSIWTANKSGTFLSGDFLNKRGSLVGVGARIYFTGFETGPWGHVSTAVGVNSTSGERKAVFVVPLKDLDIKL